MSDTPRTDAAVQRFGDHWSNEQAVPTEDARQLETELIASTISLGEALHENDRLRRMLAYQSGRADELKRRLHIYRDRDEAVEIARLHGVIHSLKAQVEGRVDVPPPYFLLRGEEARVEKAGGRA